MGCAAAGAFPAAGGHRRWRRYKIVPKYENVCVQLSECDGNIFAIVGRAVRAARRGGLSAAQIAEFTAEVKSAPSYDRALQIVMAHFDWE